MQEVVSRKRPLGVTIIALLEIVGAISFLLAVFAATSTSIEIAWVTGAIIRLILVWGLWTLKRWAFWGTVVLEVLHFSLNLFNLLVLHNIAIWTVLFGMVVNLVVLIYLFADRNVRAAFRT